jgi:hypothetical protein
MLATIEMRALPSSQRRNIMPKVILSCLLSAGAILAACSAPTPSQPEAAAVLPSLENGGSAAAQDASEQVIFSGVASTDSTFAGGASVAFSIHCEAESGNRNAGRCNGGVLRFPALGITRHVTGTNTEEDDSDLYTITVSSADGSVSCQLNNPALPVAGANNVVQVTCKAPAGAAQSNNAIVHVTGPED